jgi:hypothetical protein
MLAPGESLSDRITAGPDEATTTSTIDPATLDATADAMSRTPGAGRWAARSLAQPALYDGGGRDVIGAPRRIAVRGWSAVRGWPKAAQLGAAGGIVAVVLAVIIASIVGGRTTGNTAAPKVHSTLPSGPSFAVQSFDNGHGIVVNVPRDWKESKPKSGSYVDFLDQGNSSRKIRVNVEPSGNDPAQFLGVAEHGLERGSICKGYQRIGLAAITLDGHAAAQLEYTCGSGDAERHGIWAAATVGGKAYEFFLTVPAADFASSKTIYDEMVTSVKLTPSN